MWAIKRQSIGLLIGATLTFTNWAVTPSAPRINALPQPATVTSLDLGAMARGYAAAGAGNDTPLTAGPQLLVFISLTMPAPTLEQLFAQAQRAKAVLVLRGLVNGSWRETGAALGPLIGRQRVAVQIDPQAFDRYAITAVPSMVLRRSPITPCNGTNCPAPEQFVRTVGDVSLDYALQDMERSNPAFTDDARIFRQRLTP